MAFDLKDKATNNPDTSFEVGAFLFGADSAGAAEPSVYPVDTVMGYLLSRANIWTAKQTFTPPANTEAIVVSNYSLTGANAQSLMNLSGTWNTTGAPTAIKLNITDIASNANSLLMDLQVGGSSKFKINKNGSVTITGSGTFGTTGTTTISSGGNIILGDNTSFNSGCTLGGFVRFTANSPAQITANQNDYTAGGSSRYFQRWSSDATRSVTGLSVGQSNGQAHLIWNVGTQNIVLANDSALSTAANRFKTSTGADLTLAPGKCALVIYDSTQQRWLACLGN